MSLLPAYLNAIRRKIYKNPLTEPEAEAREDVFSLVPPPASASAETEPRAGPHERSAAATGDRNVRPIAMADLSRLSIDNDGRLYWDGNPVEVRRRILMSRAQIVGASVVGAFVIIGAIGAAIQGSAAARDWACRLGWTTSYCALPDAGPPQRTPDIPA
jgi:hypothetical protein